MFKQTLRQAMRAYGSATCGRWIHGSIEAQLAARWSDSSAAETEAGEGIASIALACPVISGEDRRSASCARSRILAFALLAAWEAHKPKRPPRRPRSPTRRW